DGNFEIYVANADGSNQTRLTNDPAGDNNPVWSPVSDEIAFTSNRFGNADLFLLNLNGNVSTLTTNPAADNNPAWSPDGTTIAFQTFANEISHVCLIGRDALNQRCITETMNVYETPVWSPNGLWLAFTSLQTSSITLFNVQDNSNVQVFQLGIEPRGKPAWSPDGLRLVFQAQVEGNLELFSALVAANEITRITSAPGTDGSPVWTMQ
ncbi:MAG: PD40 domain-containing protein, partial [Anaerolineales bacterium]|nr:PD40 domain-containing protein [Anaerolineales bacterium]